MKKKKEKDNYNIENLKIRIDHRIDRFRQILMKIRRREKEVSKKHEWDRFDKLVKGNV